MNPEITINNVDDVFKGKISVIIKELSLLPGIYKMDLFLGDSNVVTFGIDGSSVLDQIPPKILPKTVKPF